MNLVSKSSFSSEGQKRHGPMISNRRVGYPKASRSSISARRVAHNLLIASLKCAVFGPFRQTYCRLLTRPLTDPHPGTASIREPEKGVLLLLPILPSHKQFAVRLVALYICRDHKFLVPAPGACFR